MNHIKKYRLKNKMFGGVIDDVNTLNQFIENNHTKIKDLNVKKVIGLPFDTIKEYYDKLHQNEIIDTNEDNSIFTDNIKKATIAYAIVHNIELDGIDVTDMHKTYKKITTDFTKVIYRNPNDTFNHDDDGSFVDTPQQPDFADCGERILFTVSFGHVTQNGDPAKDTVDLKANAYVIDNDADEKLRLHPPTSSAKEPSPKTQSPKTSQKTQSPKTSTTQPVVTTKSPLPQVQAATSSSGASSLDNLSILNEKKTVSFVQNTLEQILQNHTQFKSEIFNGLNIDYIVHPKSDDELELNAEFTIPEISINDPENMVEMLEISKKYTKMIVCITTARNYASAKATGLLAKTTLSDKFNELIAQIMHKRKTITDKFNSD